MKPSQIVAILFSLCFIGIIVSFVMTTRKLVCNLQDGTETVHALIGHDYQLEGETISYLEHLDKEKVRRIRHLMPGETCNIYK